MQVGVLGKREHILEAAGEVFARAGYRGATMAKIAREADMQEASLRFYFADKQQLVQALYADFCEQAAILIPLPREGVKLADYVAHVIYRIVNLFAQQRDLAWILFVESPSCLTGLRDKAAERMAGLAERAAQTLAALQLLDEADAQSAARLCYATVRYGAISWLSGAWDIDMPMLCETLLRFNLRAMGHPVDTRQVRELLYREQAV